ncbi:MAG: hypothetical protein NTW11_01240 [Candidatus Staskawiczbacteria bacterium]|nr:hypothetical protein [Candidatus Staskawiczbacteria bacterium]
MEEIPGKYFAADLGGADLMDVASKHPVVFWVIFVVVVVVGIGYGIYYLAKRKKAQD